jgi:hypothetical protein
MSATWARPKICVEYQAMDDHSTPNGRPWILRPVSRAAGAALGGLADATGVALRAGLDFERRVLEPLLESPDLARLLDGLLDDPRVKVAVKRVIGSDAARVLIAEFFDSGLFDEFVDRLLASDALWRLVDEVAASPAVTAAITQQGLGFADQVGGEVRSRSRRADDWIEQRARRWAHRQQDAKTPAQEQGDAPAPA